MLWCPAWYGGVERAQRGRKAGQRSSRARLLGTVQCFDSVASRRRASGHLRHTCQPAPRSEMLRATGRPSPQRDTSCVDWAQQQLSRQQQSKKHENENNKIFVEVGKMLLLLLLLLLLM